MGRLLARRVLVLLSVLLSLVFLEGGAGRASVQGSSEASGGPVTSRSAVGAAPTTFSFGPYNDASVVSGGPWGPDQNLGGWSELSIGRHDGGFFRSYLRFLLAGLPAGIQIDSARLVLIPLDGGSQPVTIVADVVQDDWNESTITWNQQPLATWQAATVTWQSGQTAPVSIDLTEVARMWYACGGTSNNGIELSADLSSGWVNFGSRKSDHPPHLDLTYEATAIPPNCAAPPAQSGVSLAAPQSSAPSTSGAQIGSLNPNAPGGSSSVPASAPGPSTPTPCPGASCTVTRGDSATGAAASASTGSSSATGSGVASTPAASTPAPTAEATATPRR